MAMAGGVAAAQEAQTAQVRCVYIDVVHFSRGRSVEAQTLVMQRLSHVVQAALLALEVDRDTLLTIPTGDGVCLCLINQLEPFDLDIRIALLVLDQLHVLNLAERDPECRFAVRIGLNENQDNVVVDITGSRNVIGLGINMAQRVMSVAGPSQLFVGAAVYARLCQRRLYRPHLHPMQAIVKHGERLQCYAYSDLARACFAHAATQRSKRPSPGAGKPGRVVELPLGGRARGAVQRRSAAISFQLGGR